MYVCTASCTITCKQVCKRVSAQVCIIQRMCKGQEGQDRRRTTFGSPVNHPALAGEKWSNWGWKEGQVPVWLSISGRGVVGVS